MADYDDKEAILPAGGYPVERKSVVSRRIKFILLASSMFFWLLGALFCAIGGYVISQSIGYQELSDFAMDPGIIVLLLGLIIFTVSTFGVLGSLRENICLLNMYKYMLLGSLLFEVFSAFVAFAFWPEVKKMVDGSITLAIEKYSTNVDLRNMIDLLQRQLQCCGSLTIDDWDSNPYFTCTQKESYKWCGVPWSCCLTKYQRNRQCGYGMRKDRAKFNLATEIHTIGCMDKAFMFFQNNMGMIAGLCITFTFPLIINVLLIHIFVKQIHKQIGLFHTFTKQ